MNQKDLLRCIADAGYNVGFGAKKHFATYDIISKVPSAIGYFSTAVGVYALVFDSLSAKWLSASLVVIGIAGICISIYDHKKNEYSEAGEKLTGLFNQLKKLYFEVQSAEGDMTGFQTKLSEIETLSAKAAISDQILFSGWFAHYKFFWEHQIDWIDEQKKFKLFRDKLPLTFSFTVVVALLCLVVFGIYAYFN